MEVKKKQNRILKLEPLVLDALRVNKYAREDDFYLYGAVIRRLGIDLNIPLIKFLGNHTELGVPPFESVSRARRKLVEEFPELADEETKEKRRKEQGVYLEYVHTKNKENL